MGVFMQIALPLYLTFALLVVLAIVRKYVRLEVFILAAAVLAAAIIVTVLKSDTVKTEAVSAKTSDDLEISLLIADQYALDCEYDASEQILSELSLNNYDSDDVKLAYARLELLRGEYQSSANLFSQLSGKGDDGKRMALELADAQGSGDGAFVSYLNSVGKNPDEYGFTASASATADAHKAKAAVLSAIESDILTYEKTYGKDFAEAASLASKLMQLFDEYEYDFRKYEELEIALEGLKALASNDVRLSQNKYIRNAILAGNVACQSYLEIAATADENVTSDELLVMVELYTRALIGQKDFNSDFLTVDKTKAQNTVNKCYEVLKNNKDKLDALTYEKYESRVQQLENQTRDSVGYVLRSELIENIIAGEGDTSKNYIALAKLEFDSGNTELADGYIEDALISAGESLDSDYSDPMTAMFDIINGNGEDEDVKNIDKYVEDALNNSIPDDMSADNIVDEAYDAYNNEGEKDISFKDEMSNIVNESTAKLNIGIINKDNFPEVSARVQIQADEFDSLEEIKSKLVVYDCGSLISDFELVPLEFDQSRIILLCDCSGSMGGYEDDLREAIRAFANEMSDSEEVSVIGFSDEIEFICQFSSDKDAVYEYAENIFSGGGTALYNSLITSLEYFEADISCNNIMVAMTDGQDGSYANEYSLKNELGALAQANGVTVYTLGLGSGVDTAYLEKIAENGLGKFLYIDSSEKLESFYDFIHGLLDNQYVLTYNAKNQTLNKRELEISLKDSNGKAVKTYYLNEPEIVSGGADYEPVNVYDVNLVVHGLSTKFLYKVNCDQKIKLRGEGFSFGDDVEIILDGNTKYVLDVKYVDQDTYELTVPADIAVGEYDLNVNIRGENVNFKNELTVARRAKQKSLEFGDYKFSALEIHKDKNGNAVLSGNVKLNGWLSFKGEVVIENAYGGYDSVWVEDKSGAYISFDYDNATGDALEMAKRAVPFDLGCLGKFKIYSAPFNGNLRESFPVDEIELYNRYNLLFYFVDNPEIKIYPDSISCYNFGIDFSLPLIDTLMKGENVFGFMSDVKSEMTMVVNDKAVGLVGEFEYDRDFEEDFVFVSFPLRLSRFSCEVDSLKQEYQFDCGVKFKSIADSMDEIKLGLGWKEGYFDSVMLGADGKDVTIFKTPTPVTLKNFRLELNDLSDVFKSLNSNGEIVSALLETEVEQKFDVDFANLKDYLPSMYKLIDGDKKSDIAFLRFDDCTLNLKLKNFRLKFTTKAKLVNVLDIGQLEVELGHFNYTNALVGLNNVNQEGLRAKATVGPSWDKKNLKLKLNASLELTVGKPYTGIMGNGTVEFDIGWWILSKEYNVSGDFLIAGFENSSNNFQFSVILRGVNDDGKIKGFHAFVTKESGFDIYKYN